MGDTRLPLSKVLDGIAGAVLDRIAAMHPAEPVAAARPGEVAQRWRYLDGRGEFG